MIFQKINSLPGGGGLKKEARNVAGRLNKYSPRVSTERLILPSREIPEEILVYKRKAPPFFDGDSNYLRRPVSHDPSRKQFFAKLLGTAAALSVAPQLMAKSSGTATAAAGAPAPASPLSIRPDVRAVARRDGSV